jgi:Restriction endonuclease
MPDADETLEKLRAYASAYLEAYRQTVDDHYDRAYREVEEMGRGREVFPLYGRALGKTVALTALTTEDDFFLFFLDRLNVFEIAHQRPTSAEGFDRAWTMGTPEERIMDQVRALLNVDAGEELGSVRIPGTHAMAMKAAHLAETGKIHGNREAIVDGSGAEFQLPELRAWWEADQSFRELRSRYQELLAWTGSRQARGQQFEILWRDALNLHGWHSKKVRIPGEDNDFTALYSGLHILGEVRWYTEPMAGGKMREFLAKLDPRPQTIGLFVSHSGYDDGARSVVRRAINSKTIVMFEQQHIEQVLLDRVPPGDLFDVLLRDAYDYLFENQTSEA